MANSIETPSYTVQKKLSTANGDKIEIRHYDAFVQAVTRTTGDNAGFGTLAGYIFGGNARKESIAMTAPVMTSSTASGPQMAFMMPGDYDLDSLPAPNDPRVSFETVPARNLAVITFSGLTTRSKIKTMNERLLSTLQSEHIETLGEPILNRYNPPWTLPFLRTNEIHYEIR